MNLSEVLGAFGPGKIVKALGREWSFVFDVPAMAANIEEMCEAARRAVYEKEVRLLPDRNVPGSFDQQIATKLFEELRQELRDGACSLPRGDKDGGGVFYKKWSRSKEGQAAMALSSLRVKHPDADLQTLIKIAEEAPDQVKAVFDDLGKALRDAVPKLAASLKDSGHHEASEMLTKGMEELETSLSGSPA